MNGPPSQNPPRMNHSSKPFSSAWRTGLNSESLEMIKLSFALLLLTQGSHQSYQKTPLPECLFFEKHCYGSRYWKFKSKNQECQSDLQQGLPTRRSLLGIDLKEASGDVWRKAFESQLSEQKLFDNIANEFTKVISRTIGWLVLDIILYQGRGIGSRRKKRANFDFEDEQQPRTFSLLNGIYLMPSSGDVWKNAFESQLSEQRMFDNVANVVSNFFIRAVGWTFLELLLYQGKHSIPTNEDP